MNARTYDYILNYGVKIVDWENGSICLKYTGGNKLWHLKGKLHRTNGPAVETANGTKHWHTNGLRHRADGPAIEYADDDKEWWLNGKLHRKDGPAIEYADVAKRWYLDNKEYTEKEFNTIQLMEKK